MPPVSRNAETPSPSQSLAALAGQARGEDEAAAPTPEHTVALLLLRVGRRWFGVPPDAVRQVTMKGHVTRVPTVPAYVLGVTLIRGRLVPVIALEGLLGSTGAGETAPTLPRLVVLRDGDTELAIVADETRGVIEQRMRAAPDETRSAERAPFLGAELEWEGKLVCLLDVPALVAETAPPEPAGP